MSAFHEVSLPLAYALGASGALERRVDIVALGSGAEARNTPWAHGRRRYDVGGAVRTLDDLHALIAFFEARRGRLHGFRFRDPFDHKSCAPSQTVTALDQQIGIGDGEAQAFFLRKNYGEGDAAYARPIVKPSADSIVIAVDGAVLTPEAYVASSLTGLVTLDTPPAVSAVVTAGFSFDTPVRFDVDRLDLALDGFGAGHALSAPLIEIRL